MGGYINGDYEVLRGMVNRGVAKITRTAFRFCIITGLALVSLNQQVYPILFNQIQKLPLIKSISVSICGIQGDSFSSPYLGQAKTVRGIVYADMDETNKRGFFIQDENCDGDPDTSDGIFVYLGERLDIVDLGDFVKVSGVVNEYFGMTEIIATIEDIMIISKSNPVPAPVELNPPYEASAAREYFETVEGMYVELGEAVVVGPTNSSDETWVVNSNLGISRVFWNDPVGNGEIICVDDAGLFEINPEGKVGDRIYNLAGALGFSAGIYRMQLTQAPVLKTSDNKIVRSGISRLTLSDFRLATFNLANLFDPFDDPNNEDTVLSAAEYQRRLEKRARAIHSDLGEPEILVFQEVENKDVLADLIARPEIESDYGFVFVEGLDFRGMDLGVLYRKDRVVVQSFTERQKCTTLEDGLGPDGNRDVNNPQNKITCDPNDDGILNGNRLFSRPPLVIQVDVCQFTGCQLDTENNVNQRELWLIVSHLKSKIEDTDSVQYTLPRRIQQAQFLAELVQEIETAHPTSNIVITGDLNDYPESLPLMMLADQGTKDLSSMIEKSDRYTYVYHGVSEVIDYILVKFSAGVAAASITPIHINADYPAVFDSVNESSIRSSDHDPLIAGFTWLDNSIYLPMMYFDSG